jgi:hypothetical protein
MYLIRLILAGLFCSIGWFIAAVLVFDVLPKNTPPFLIAIVFAAVFLVTVVIALTVFNLGRRKVPPGPSLEELEAQGLVVSNDFHATRAFEVDEFEDEGRHLFIELADGSVLFLTGQYLYDFGLSEAETEAGASGDFPTTNFTIKRHKVEGYVMDIICHGTQLKPELLAKPFGPEVWDRDGIPEDGAIIRDRTYEEIKAEHTARK